MTKMKSRSLALLLMLCLSMILAACTSSGEVDNSADENRKKILTYGHSGIASSLDPSHMQEGDSFLVIANLYETLVSFGEQEAVVVPGLAETWSASDDGLTYRFTLQKDVTFHDEEDFNADVVVKNFERWSSGDSGEFPYYQSVFGGEENPVIKSVKADGEDTVIIELNYPQESFLKQLTMSPFSMVSPTSWELSEEDAEYIPIGTGPFKFVEGKLNETITVMKFEEYWQENLPKLNKVIFKSIPNDIARLNALIAKDIDLADHINPIDRMEIMDDTELQFFERPYIANLYGDSSVIPKDDTMPIVGATIELEKFMPHLTGFDKLSKVEFKVQVEE